MFASKVLHAGLLVAALLLAAPAAFADNLTLSGEVTYRERIALPPDAELLVTLVSLPGAQPIVSASAQVGTPAQVPLHYTLNVLSDVVGDDGDYGLLAEIRSEGRTLFRNSQPVPVDVTAPVPTLIIVSFSPDAPHAAPEQVVPPVDTPNPLLDTAWRVIGIGGDPVFADTQVTLSIAADLRAGGHSGCNNYFTEASFEGPPLSFGPIAGTRMACTPATMAQETELFAALNATAGYELSGDSLMLFDAAGVPRLELVRLQ